MDTSVIITLPLGLILYGTALFFCLFERIYRSTGGMLFLLSTAIAVAATAYCLLMGASCWECCTVLTVFLLLNVGVKE